MTTTRPGLRSVLIALAVTGWFTVTVLLVLQPGSRSTDA